MVGDGSRRRDGRGGRRVCGGVGMMAGVGVRVRKTAVEGSEVLGGGAAGVALATGFVVSGP